MNSDTNIEPKRKKKTKKYLNNVRKKMLEKRSQSEIDLKENFKSKLNNITKSRITLKRGIFAKGVRTQTYSRFGLNEEFRARRDGDLHKIIDLANKNTVEIENDDNILIRGKEDEINEDVIPVTLEEAKKDSSSGSLKNFRYQMSTQKTDNEVNEIMKDPSNKELFRKEEIKIVEELKQTLPDRYEEQFVCKLKTYLRDIYKETLSKKNIAVINKPKQPLKVDNKSKKEHKSNDKIVTLNPLQYLDTINKINSKNNSNKKRKNISKQIIIEDDESFCEPGSICNAPSKCKTNNSMVDNSLDSNDSDCLLIDKELLNFDPPEPKFFPRKMNF